MSSAPPPLKVGFVGLSSNSGWASMITFPALRAGTNPEKYTLVAVSTRSSESAIAAATKYGDILQREVTPYHGDPSQLVNDPDVDVVGISVKTVDHEKVMGHVLKAGKPFYLEWPAGCGSEETKEFARIAAEKGIKHMIGLQDRQNPFINKIKEIIDSGRIGKVQATNILSLCTRDIAFWGPEIWDNNEYSNEPESHATLLDILIMHQMEPFTYILGDWKSVSATTSTQWPTATLIPSGRKKPNRVPDHYSFTGLLESGAQASVSWRAGYLPKGRKELLWEIDGSEGILRFESESSRFLAAKGRLYLDDEEIFVDGEGDPVSIMARQWEEFAKPDGSYAGLADAVRLKRLSEAIETSAKEGRRVEIGSY